MNIAAIYGKKLFQNTVERTETEHLVKEQMGHNVWTAVRSVRIAVPAAGLSGGHSGAKWGAEARIGPG